MRRGIAKLSLFAALAFFFQPSAVPWREKNAFKIATSLPKRLIDSIMAQGNWNILFQEGPFAEFQRQIAIANHFTLRGETKQARHYFEKAGNALDIAYASLRGRFGWPRDAKALTAANLPWGENRETFEDFLLCRLQLEIESLLTEHEAGVLKAANFAASVAETERQLAAPLVQKDSDLELMVAFVRDAAALRARKEHPAIAAEKYAALSDKIAPSVRNYWNRRLGIFRIFENLYYGNSGRACFLARYLEDKQKDQTDPMGLARIYVYCGGYQDAYRVLQTALANKENQIAENLGDYLSYSGVAQNLLLHLNRKTEAESVSRDTLALLEKHRDSGTIPQDELVDLRRAVRNETWRLQVYGFITTGKCPAPAMFSADTDMETDWRVKERVFFENCGLTRDRAAWSALIKEPGLSKESRAVAAYHTNDEGLTSRSGKKDGSLGAFLLRRRALANTLNKNQKDKLPEITVSYLKALNNNREEFGIFDWGLNLTDDLTDRALVAMPSAVSEKTGRELLAELHLRYSRNHKGQEVSALYAPIDASLVLGKTAAAILDLTGDMSGFPAAVTVNKRMVYTDTLFIAVLDPTARKDKWRLLRKSPGTSLAAVLEGRGGAAPYVLYGSAPAEFPAGLTGYLPPLRSFCADCGKIPEKNPERLTLIGLDENLRRTLTSDLADNFSVTADSGHDCPGGATKYDDGVIVAGAPASSVFPCNLVAEKMIVDPEKTEAALAMGWRPGLAAILMPASLPAPVRTAFLFDFFQRTNRRQSKPAEAFREARARAEKSFPAEPALGLLRYYESLP